MKALKPRPSLPQQRMLIQILRGSERPIYRKNQTAAALRRRGWIDKFNQLTIAGRQIARNLDRS